MAILSDQIPKAAAWATKGRICCRLSFPYRQARASAETPRRAARKGYEKIGKPKNKC